MLLLLPALFAGGVLYVRYKLEDFRDSVRTQAESKLGLQFDKGTVEVNGLRGLRIRDFKASFGIPLGPNLRVDAPETFINIDLIDLLYGQMTVEQIEVTGASLELSPGPEGTWLSAAGGGGAGLVHNAIAFRLVGSDCRLRIADLGAGQPLELSGLSFDISRQPKSPGQSHAPDIVGRLQSWINGEEGKTLGITARYGAVADFDLRIAGAGLSSSDLNAYLPESARILESGSLRPELRLSGYPDQTVVLSAQLPFEGLSMRAPELPLDALDGSLTALATYDLRSRLLSLTAARARTNLFQGDLEGSIAFADTPALDLRLDVGHLPVEDTLNQLLGRAVERYGTIELALDPSYQLSLTMQGALSAPILGVEAEAPGGTLAFAPANTGLPEADLDFGSASFAWNSLAGRPTGTLQITGGTLRHGSSDLNVEDVTGTLNLTAEAAAFSPLNAVYAGNPVLGKVTYDLERKETAFEVSGLIANVERFPWLEGIGKTTLQGDVQLRAAGTAAAGRIVLDISADATQAMVEHDWFFLKPPGVGAGVREAHVELVPNKTLDVTARAAVDTTELAAVVRLGHSGGRWKPREFTASTDAINVVSASECLRLPYAFSGEPATDASLSWSPSPDDPAEGVISTAVSFPQVTLQPADSEAPVVCRNAHLTTSFNSGKDPKEAQLTLKAEEVRLPALSSPWLPPFRPADPDLDARFPRSPVLTTFALEAGRILLPPWSGSRFTGSGFLSEERSALEQFAAELDGGGRLEGSYVFERSDKVSALTVRWEEVAAHYILEHMKFPDLLTGTLTGDINYTVDRDDPGTLDGAGHFTITEGQFSADFIVKHLEEQLEMDLSSLPPSLKFSELSADVRLEGDKVTTENLLLASEGITMSGQGYFIVSGDMDYLIDVAISPETAARIPVLRDNLNVSGHRATQTDIKLAFHITGPTFSPSGRVAGLPPVGVTLVNGAVTVGSEVIKIIDTPRQIIIDLFKIIGGTVGVRR